MASEDLGGFVTASTKGGEKQAVRILYTKSARHGLVSLPYLASFGVRGSGGIPAAEGFTFDGQAFFLGRQE